jgi:hypothetical protein
MQKVSHPASRLLTCAIRYVSLTTLSDFLRSTRTIAGFRSRHQLFLRCCCCLGMLSLNDENSWCSYRLFFIVLLEKQTARSSDQWEWGLRCLSLMPLVDVQKVPRECLAIATTRLCSGIVSNPIKSSLHPVFFINIGFQRARRVLFSALNRKGRLCFLFIDIGHLQTNDVAFFLFLFVFDCC